MKFRVNDGQTIWQLNGLPGAKAERKQLKGGDEVEGPDWWVREFAGRMTPLDDAGNPIDLQALSEMSQDLATAKAHERVSLLREMIDRNPTLAEALQPELDKAEAEAETARQEFETKRLDRAKADAERLAAGAPAQRNPPRGQTAGPAAGPTQ